MQVLLLKDVYKLGHVGDVVDVRPGYARNCLLPQRLATEPTEENIAAIAEEKKRAAAERARRLKEYNDLLEQLQDVQVTIEAAANPEGTLYGSVGAKEIADALHAQGFGVAPQQVHLDAPIRTLDNRMVEIRFTDEVKTEIKVWVVKEGGPAHAEESTERPETEEPAEPAERE
jgi:large subunit ribosomal protein L9